MKIVYLHQYFNTPSMPGGTRSYEMARRLVSSGHEVHMVTSWRQGDKADDWFVTNEAGIKVHWLPVTYSNHMSYRERISAFFRFAFRSLRKVNELDADVVFATSTPLTIAIPAVLAARNKKIPMVFEVRDLWPELPVALGALRNPIAVWLARRLERLAYFNSEAVIALSPGMKQGVVRTGYPSNKVAVIPNGSDNLEFKHDPVAAKLFRESRSWLNNRPLLVYGGTFGQVNGVGFMVDLAYELSLINPEACILLVGDGQEKEKVRDQAIKRGVLGVNLFIEDAFTKEQMPALLSAADMLSSVCIDLPELRANSANKFFDALASGTPILLNYGGWQHDLITVHECGLAMWGRPIKEVAREVENKITDPLWLRDAGNAARELAETLFDRDKLAAQFEEVIQLAYLGKGELVANITPEN